MRRLRALWFLVLFGCAQQQLQPSDVTMRVKPGWTEQQVLDAVGKPTATHAEGEWDYIFPETQLMVAVTFDKTGKVAQVETSYYRP